MGWQDRDYYRERSSFGGNPLMWLLTGSIPLFTVFGIRVRMHVTLLILIIIQLLFSETSGGLGAKNAVVSMTILFNSILLHEFGHCFGARWVGGHADQILMWPLGGLASTDPPRRPWPSFISTAAGPAVNLIICIITGLALAIFNHSAEAIPWFPVRDGLRTYVPHDMTTYYLWWIFLVNYALLVFNMLLVFYPFDAGRMIQEILWVFIGYYRSMRIATVIGMIGAVIVGMIGLASWSLLLILIAFFGFTTCMRQRQAILEMGPGEFDEVDYSQSLYDSPSMKRAYAREKKKNLKNANQRRTEEQKIDRILAKVSAKGMHSLTWWEKRTLRKGSQRLR